jgi:hypothetical protein
MLPILSPVREFAVCTDSPERVSYEKAIEMAHRSLQPRLDGYRQTGASFLTALVAFSAAFDAFAVKLDLTNMPPGGAWVMTALTIGLCILVLIVLSDARVHFSEVSGRIVLIERRIGLFQQRADGSESIYPPEWDRLDLKGRGWDDFALRACSRIAWMVLLIQTCICFVWFEPLRSLAGRMFTP